MNFLIYNVPGEEASVSVIVKNETIWLTQKAMAELFQILKLVALRELTR